MRQGKSHFVVSVVLYLCEKLAVWLHASLLYIEKTVKVKFVKLSLCLTEHHAMKAYGEQKHKATYS